MWRRMSGPALTRLRAEGAGEAVVVLTLTYVGLISRTRAMSALTVAEGNVEALTEELAVERTAVAEMMIEVMFSNPDPVVDPVVTTPVVAVLVVAPEVRVEVVLEVVVAASVEVEVVAAWVVESAQMAIKPRMNSA
jgi:hypothetical protein